MQAILQNNIETIRELCRRYHVKELYAFGSAVRDDFNGNSDLDFIVSYFKDSQGLPAAPFDYFDLLFALEHTTGRHVDLVSEDAIKNKYFSQRIEKEKIKLYAA